MAAVFGIIYQLTLHSLFFFFKRTRYECAFAVVFCLRFLFTLLPEVAFGNTKVARARIYNNRQTLMCVYRLPSNCTSTLLSCELYFLECVFNILTAAFKLSEISWNGTEPLKQKKTVYEAKIMKIIKMCETAQRNTHLWSLSRLEQADYKSLQCDRGAQWCGFVDRKVENVVKRKHLPNKD